MKSSTYLHIGLLSWLLMFVSMHVHARCENVHATYIIVCASLSNRWGVRVEVLNNFLRKIKYWPRATKLSEIDLMARTTLCHQGPPPGSPRKLSGTIYILQVWLRGQGRLGTLLIMLESWNLAHKSRIILGGCWWFLTSSWCFLVVVLDGTGWSLPWDQSLKVLLLNSED